MVASPGSTRTSSPTVTEPLQVVPVTTSSTIEVKRVLYTVPSRLIGERLRLHIFDARIEGYIGSAHAVTLPRVYAVSHERRARCIDYRHVIASLARKPQAFRYSQLRDDLLPNATYRRIWAELDARLEPRAACKRIVGILALAARAEALSRKATPAQARDIEAARRRLSDADQMGELFKVLAVAHPALGILAGFVDFLHANGFAVGGDGQLKLGETTLRYVRYSYTTPPENGGASTRRTPSARAMPQQCSGPLPP